MSEYNILFANEDFTKMFINKSFPMHIEITDSSEFKFEISKFNSNYDQFSLEYILEKLINNKAIIVKIFDNIDSYEILDGIFFVLSHQKEFSCKVEYTEKELKIYKNNSILIQMAKF